MLRPLSLSIQATRRTSFGTLPVFSLEIIRRKSFFFEETGNLKHYVLNFSSLASRSSPLVILTGSGLTFKTLVFRVCLMCDETPAERKGFCASSDLHGWTNFLMTTRDSVSARNFVWAHLWWHFMEILPHRRLQTNIRIWIIPRKSM